MGIMRGGGRDSGISWIYWYFMGSDTLRGIVIKLYFILTR